LLSGCFTGERPYFTSDPLAPGNPTGDPAIDAVLSELDAVTDGPATALYAVLTKFGNTTSSATVVLDDDRRAIEVNTIRYLTLADEQFTCLIEPTTGAPVDCVRGLDPARISDVGITIDFYASEAARRLRRDAQAKVAPAVGHEETIANQTATCVTVTVVGGTVVYCVLANGMIARLDDADVSITLGLLATTADSAKLRPPAD
jgi:hypothetical protein